jgi:hypothetical protein
MKQKKGVIYKGKFWPLYGGGVLFNSEKFSSCIMDGIAPTLRANKADAAVCVEYEDRNDN